jgi:GNAT superfamily N-acetyltransferase
MIPAGAGRVELAKMSVAPTARRRGIGRELLQAALDWATRRGFAEVFLGSSTRLPAAISLYESAGFTHVSPTTLDMPYHRADIFMIKPLR